MNNKSLYIECASGISGDMAVAALLDLGADKDVLLKKLSTVPVDGFEVKISRVNKSGLDCCDFDVILSEEYENHDHDMEYLFGDDHHDHEHHEHSHEQEHHHEHTHEHEHHHSHEHSHVHRTYSDVCKIIDGTDLSEKENTLAKKIFFILAKAEAKAHGKTVEEVHFHEVGAVDSIVDVISLAVCFVNLGVENVYVEHINEGKGTVRCAHGILPIPVPAVLNIVSEYGINLEIMNVKGEFVTPTGAAFVAGVKTHDVLPLQFKILKNGLGAGKREYERPSFLRMMLIEEVGNKTKLTDTVFKLETNIDDCSSEALAFTLEELMSNGALDVHFIPCVMKKNRPAYLLTVICSKEKVSEMEKIIFLNTTSIGIRRYETERTKLERTVKTVSTEYGDAKVKVCSYEGNCFVYPEYDSVAELSRKNKISFKEMFDIVKKSGESDEQNFKGNKGI